MSQELETLALLRSFLADCVQAPPHRIQIAEAILPMLLMDHSQRSPDELQELADMLSPGGAHTSGQMALSIMGNLQALLGVDQRLLASMIYTAWHGGKVGFQFLPNPLEIGLDEYWAEGEGLLHVIESGTDWDPLSILTDSEDGLDRQFYASLPERFTIYRGGWGIEPEQLAAGVCWTTRRDVAEWFACRFSFSRNPVVVSARIHKSEVRLARAVEFEVVAQPRMFRTLKIRKGKAEQPPMEWKPDTV